MKRIVICADGTWNRPERENKDDYPTNVLRFARGVDAHDDAGVKQIVFYDWGIGSYHDKVTAGAFGIGLDKNVMDGYRFLVHNYEPGDEIFLFGFSRGAYTIRSLCGLINNCSILKSENGHLIEKAFSIYKTKRYKPHGDYATKWRQENAIQDKVNITFVGVWDTVGAMGLPFTVFGLLKEKHLFYDRKMGSNIKVARHALSLDENRDDFEPTIWEPHPQVDLQQVWFTGVHSDVGGTYKADKDGTRLSDIPFKWMMDQACKFGLKFEPYMYELNLNSLATKNNGFKGIYKFLGKRTREIPNPKKIPTFVHESVFERMEKSSYRSAPLEDYRKKYNSYPPVAPQVH